LQDRQAKLPFTLHYSNGAKLRLIIYEIYDICIFPSPLQAKLKGLNRYINSRAHMISPKGKPVICEELTWKDVDKLKNTMKMTVKSAKVCEQPSLRLPLAVDTIDCSSVAKRISKRNALPETIDKIVDLIATKLVKFLIVIIVFVQKKSGGGGKRTI
jgi:hypothetical protein